MSGEAGVAGGESNAEESRESDANPGGDSTATDSKPRYAATRSQLNTDAFEDVFAQIETEPAVPEDINQQIRRQTRLVPESHKTERLHRPLVVCGCEEDCPDRYDPLAEEMSQDTHAFGDHLDRSDMAADECEDAQPITIGRAAEAYYRYQMADYHRGDRTSKLDRVEAKHGQYLDAERRLLDEMDSPSTALLSLRVSPLEGGDDDSDTDNYEVTPKSTSNSDGSETSTTNGMDSEGGVSEPNPDHYEVTPKNHTDHSDPAQDWIEPVRLDERIHDSWESVRETLRYHLDEFEDWEYAWVVSTTDTAATPHLHVYLYVEDPDDELTVKHLRPAVESYVSNTIGAHPDDHRVSADESDAATVFHDPETISYEPSQVRQILREMDTDRFKPNTRGLAYLLSQRPDWALRRILTGQSSRDDEQTALEGAAIAWASPKKWLDSSEGFDT
jgi:hypothetical protein